MPIDYNILLQNRGTQSDPGAAMERGMRMGDQLEKKKKETAMRDAFKANTQVGPDGKATLNRDGLFSTLSGIDPMLSLELQDRFQAQDAQAQKAQMEKQAKEWDTIGRVAGAIKDQASWDQGKAFLAQSGIDVSQLPKTYDASTANLVQNYRLRAQSVAEQMAAQRSDRDFGLKQQELEIKRREAGGKGGGGGKAPQGYRFKADGSGALEPIPGGPDATAAGIRDEKKKVGAGLVVQDIGRSLDLIKKSPSAAGTGDFGLLSYVPGSPTQSLDHLLDSVKSNIGFDKLQAMREASPTGGALGSVSEKETAMLQATAGKLSSNMPEDQLQDNLKRLYNQYNDIIHGPGKGPERHKLSFDELGRPVERSIVNGPSGGQVKEIGGVKYIKVEGGWEEMPMPASR